MYEPRGLREGYDLPIQSSGTLPLNNALEAAYKEEFITILPNNASSISFNEDLTILMSPLNLCNSCVNTVFIDSLYSTGKCFIMSCTLNCSGKSPKIV